MSVRRLSALLALALALCAGGLVTAHSAQAQGLRLGFSADPVLAAGNAADDSVWIPRAVVEGASMVRVNVYWSQVAPATPPPGFTPADPASPGYDWTAVDTAVRDLTGHGLQVLLTISSAPTWAEAGGAPPGTQPGAWKPDATQLTSFATAAALRYDGRFPDPLRPGALLPRVRYWEPWNEPNLSLYLAPQWTRAGSGWAPASPDMYRQLLNASYAAVKGVSPSNFVIAAGTAPYGDPPGGQRMAPVAFDRYLFCLRDDPALRPTSCSDPPHLDALDHHPYGIRGPMWHAINADDVAVPDVYKLARVLQAAEREGHVLPRGPKQLWSTEISWDSSPPDPNGVPIAEQARWLEQALYVLWRQGVDTVLWLQIIDAPPIPNYASTYQAGLYYLNGEPKPAAQAFRFPFVTQRLDRGHVLAWGRAPAAGRLAIEIQLAHGQRALRTLSVSAGQVFQATLAIRGRAVLDARLGSQQSLTWKQGA